MSGVRRIKSRREFRELVSQGSGYIFNVPQSFSDGTFVPGRLHRASCTSFRMSTTGRDKHFSVEISALAAWAEEQYGSRPVWDGCRICRPHEQHRQSTASPEDK